MNLPVLEEVHTTDLGTSCPMKTRLRLLGREEKVAQTALYRGSLANHALVFMHKYEQMGAWDEAIQYARRWVDAEYEEEGRGLSETVERDREKIEAEVHSVLAAYARRLGDRFEKCQLIGCELPVYLEAARPSHGVAPGVTMTEAPIIFKSHLDLLIRDPDNVFGRGENRLIFFDWKFTDTEPFNDYLSRNKQFQQYHLSIRYGSVGTDTEGTEWVQFDTWPQGCWLHLRSLKRYTRKTTRKTPDGEQMFTAGDERPESAVLKWSHLSESRAHESLESLVDQVRMMEAGFYPALPDPVGCLLCQSKQWCPRYDEAPTGME